jgi:predicted Rossmann fold flavoprotein
LGRFGPSDLIDLMNAGGVPTYVEPGGKVFPVSMKATDVLGVLLHRFRQSGATMSLDEPVESIETDVAHSAGLRIKTNRRTLHARRVVLATGGMSYPGCGTTGDGYAWAKSLGHSIVTPRAALAPLTTDAAWVKELQGITIGDCVVRLTPADHDAAHKATSAVGRKRGAFLAERRGSLLFAHFGLSGPAAMDVSRFVSGAPRGARPSLVCDFTPTLSEAELDARLAAAASESGRRQAGRLLDDWLPARLGRALVVLAGVDPERKAAELGRDQRRQLAALAKQTAIRLTGTLGFEKAEVTAGGVALDEVDFRTMESRIAPGLFVVGELLDLDGPIGGYNLQAAFSTGHLAGDNA